MTIENCRKLLKHFLDKGMSKEAEDMKAALDRKRLPSRSSISSATPTKTHKGK